MPKIKKCSIKKMASSIILLILKKQLQYKCHIRPDFFYQLVRGPATRGKQKKSFFFLHPQTRHSEKVCNVLVQSGERTCGNHQVTLTQFITSFMEGAAVLLFITYTDCTMGLNFFQASFKYEKPLHVILKSHFNLVQEENSEIV